MAKDDNSVIFLKDWKVLIQSLSPDNQLYFWKLFTDYEYQSNKECNNDYVKPIWNFVKSQLDNMKEKYINKTVKTNQENGKLGGRPKKIQDNPNNPMGFYETQITPKDKDNNNDKENVNKDILFFSQIENLSDYLKSYESDKRYLFIAYKFWELWKDESPGDQTLQKAKVFNWSDEVRKMVELDKTSIERLLAIYSYFSKCDTKGFDRFWFDNIQSMAGLRGKNKNQEYKIDKIIKMVNAKIQSDDEFSIYLNSIIEKFNKYESLKSS